LLTHFDRYPAVVLTSVEGGRRLTMVVGRRRETGEFRLRGMVRYDPILPKRRGAI
jgi:hypothetical protein